MRSTVGRQLNSKAERWYHGEGRRQERKHGATASPEFLTGDLTGAGDPPHGTPLLSSSAVRPGRFPHCPARLATPPGDPRRTSGESSTNRAAVGDFAWSPNSVGPSPMRSRDLEIGRPGKIGSLTHPPGRTPRRSTNVRRRCARSMPRLVGRCAPQSEAGTRTSGSVPVAKGRRKSGSHRTRRWELVEKARIVARVVDDVGAEGREFAVERHRRLRNEVSTPDHAKALVRISRGSGMRQERRALDAVPRRAPTCDPVGTAPLAAHDRM